MPSVSPGSSLTLTQGIVFKPTDIDDGALLSIDAYCQGSRPLTPLTHAPL